jgi:hypothetical protein
MATETVNTSLPINGFGILSVGTVSAAISSLTKDATSPAYPTDALPNAAVTITNAGTATAYICPFGGTCKTTTGIPLAANETRTFAIGGSTTAPTVISGSAATLTVVW